MRKSLPHIRSIKGNKITIITPQRRRGLSVHLTPIASAAVAVAVGRHLPPPDSPPPSWCRLTAARLFPLPPLPPPSTRCPDAATAPSTAAYTNHVH